MVHQLRFTAEKIAKRIELIRPYVFRRTSLIEPFRLTLLPDPNAGHDEALTPPRTVPWNSFWAGQDAHFHLASSFVLPKDWPDPALHLPLGKAGDIFTHPEALMSIDGEPVGSADRYHHTTPLAAHLADGKAHRLVLEGWTGLTGWPPSPDDPAKLFIGECAVVDVDRTLDDLIIKAEVALDVANHLGDERPEKHRLLNTLDAAFKALDTRAPLKETLRASAPGALDILDAGIADAGLPLDIDLVAIGHGHIDIAYLWPVVQGRKKVARTVANMLRLMDRHEDVHFSQSQPQLYAFLEQDQPAMFERVRERVVEGRFEPMGGMWVEADTNLPGAEALVRQLLLGRSYFRRTFGDAETPVLWLPDCFGFTWCLPQLMKQAELRWFVTNKLGWNQYNPMPASTTWWQGIDGTRILAHFLTTPRDVQHLPFPTCYKSDLSAEEVIGTWEQCRGKSTTNTLPICYGYGDGGGGPTETLIAKARAYERMPAAPRLRMGAVRDVFEHLEESEPDLPVWNGELYMEGHRGVLTSQARLKRGNRRSEAALHEAEFLLALANINTDHPVPTDAPRELWQDLCLNQFLDILPGCGTGEVVKEAEQRYHVIEGKARKLARSAVDALAETFKPSTRWLAVNAS
ncbi:MAG: alpha-mannosidase, partial [Pseudomonadota bacterium]